MSFPTIKVTNIGKKLFASVLAGSNIEFTHFALGKGALPNSDDWAGLTAPVAHVMDCNITKFSRVDDKVVLQGEFSNATVPESFLWTELCIYATIPGDDEYRRVMVLYGNADALAEYIPGPDSATAVTHRWDTTIALSSALNVSALVQSITYATNEQLNNHTGNQNNPHNVTKEQIGLGNVENYSPDGMIVNFADIGGLREFVKGDPLKMLMSKTATAIGVLLSHLNGKANPHDVTAAQAGAAPKEHRSSGADYGMATAGLFGHVKLSDAYDGGEGSGDGIAATPKAVRTAVNTLSGFHGRYYGTGTIHTGTDLLKTGTPINMNANRIPKMLFIHGTGEAAGHFAILHVNEASATGIAFVNGVAFPLAGTFWQSLMTYYIYCSTLDGASAKLQMNMKGVEYEYTAIY